MKLVFFAPLWNIRQEVTTAEEALALSIATLSDGLRPWVWLTGNGEQIAPELPFDTTVPKTIFNVKLSHLSIAERYGIKEGPTAKELVATMRETLDKLEAML